MKNINELTEKIKEVMKNYRSRYSDVEVDRDYYPFKLTEEWGECMQSYLMLTDRGRQKGKSKEEIKEEFADELADTLGFLLLFADHEGIDLEQALEKKWFARLKEKE